MLAQIRNGELVRRFPEAKGWVIAEDGARLASPPVAGATWEGYPDKIVEVTVEEVDESTGDHPIRVRTETIVSEDAVVDRAVTEDAPVAADEVQAEAEHKIIAGRNISVPGYTSAIQFRCDDNSMGRLLELMYAFDNGMVPVEGKTFTTAAGVAVTFTEKAQVEAIYQIALKYRTDVLEASSALQAMSPTPSDYATRSEWPDPKA